MLNVHSDDHQITLKYFKDTEVNLQNILIMTDDFNIRDSIWDPFYLFYLSHSNSLLEIADSLDLKLSNSIQQISTQYLDNANNTNLVIDLFFLCSNSMEINNHSINPDIWYLSDHAPLTINIVMTEEFIQDKWYTIVKNSKKEKNLFPILFILLEILTLQLSLTMILLNSLFKNMYILQNQYGINIWKLSRLPNNIKLSGIKSVKWNLESISYLKKLKIERHSKILSKE